MRDNFVFQIPATPHTPAVVHNLRTEMRLTTILILTSIYITASGQRLTGKYHAYYGHSLELKSDSTFKHEWKFDLASTWATGQWSVSNSTIHLKFKNIYDTLRRTDKPDSLVISIDEKSSRIAGDEYAVSLISSGGQRHDNVPNKLAIRGKRLYLMDSNDRLLRTREPGIWTKKKRPTYYFKAD